MPVIGAEKVKAQRLALFLLPLYLEDEKVNVGDAALLFGEQLIQKLGLRALNALITEMQYTLAGIEDTTE